jgi:hypothetical protein
LLGVERCLLARVAHADLRIPLPHYQRSAQLRPRLTALNTIHFYRRLWQLLGLKMIQIQGLQILLGSGKLCLLLVGRRIINLNRVVIFAICSASCKLVHGYFIVVIQVILQNLHVECR